ncbi:MAG: hypothetical protein IJF78_08075 [Clostridia bacterium]|nr:hypothetical protein [Clostridia bacterium]
MKPFEKAKWIWEEGFDGVNTYVTFYDLLELNGSADGCVMNLSVDTNYCLEINGDTAAMGQYADYPFDKVYDAIDLSAHLIPGENRIVIRCWHQGNDSSTVRGETAGLIYEIQRGEEVLAFSSTETFSAPEAEYDMGPVEYVSGQLGFSFRYHSGRVAKEEPPTVEADKPMPTRLRPIRKLTVGDDEPALLTVRGTFRDKSGDTIGQKMQYAALAFRESGSDRPLPDENGIRLTCDDDDDGVFAIIDTGRENAGILSLDIETEEECDILIGWGEHLDDCRVRAWVGGRNFCALYHAHKGRNSWVNPFRRLGLRYMQLHIYSKSAKIFYAGIRTTDYPLDYEAEFTCADSLHTKIYEVAKRTLLMCMHEHYEDCPWREQALYTMDSRNQMLCGYYAFREFDFPKASIRLMAQSIREDNLLELCSPARVSITIPSFSAIFLTQVYEYAVHSGDKEFAREMLPVMRRIADEFIGRMDPKNGLIPCFKEQRYWNFYEWRDGLDGSISGSVAEDDVTYDAPLCAFVSFGLRSLADLMDLLGEDGSFYRGAHLKLNGDIDREFWDDDRGCYNTYIKRSTGERFHFCELTNSLIVYAGAAEGKRLDAVLGRLASGELLYVSLSHSFFKYEALIRRPEKYARTVFGDIARQWGHMLYNNATTFWETILGEADFGRAGSLCHGWSAVPIYFYHKYALELGGSVTGLYECAVE